MSKEIIFILTMTTFYMGECIASNSGEHERVYEVPFVKLISRPELYDGRLIATSGFVLIDQSMVYIFLSHLGYETAMFEESVPVQFDNFDPMFRLLDGQKIKFEGRFRLKSLIENPSGNIVEIRKFSSAGLVIWDEINGFDKDFIRGAKKIIRHPSKRN